MNQNNESDPREESVSVNANDVLSILSKEHSELMLRYAHSEARRLYLEQRVKALQQSADL